MIASIDTMGDADVPLLAQRAQAGSMEEFDVLVKRYEGSIYGYLFRSLGNREDALDYKQQVFMKAWLNLASLQNMAYFSTWLFSIARNLVRDYWRAKKPSCLYWEELVVDTEELSTRGPEESIADVELMRLALAELSPKLRYCLLLRVVCGYLPCEIACMVGINAASVGTYISLARRQLLVIFNRLMSEEQCLV
ncbi:MAG TPA: RNA polymerase sigma factor [Ktedonobacteraceae bacterium]